MAKNSPGRRSPLTATRSLLCRPLGQVLILKAFASHGYGILLSSTLASGSRHTDYRITNFELDYVFSTALINSNFYPSMATDQRQGLSWGNISISRSPGHRHLTYRHLPGATFYNSGRKGGTCHIAETDRYAELTPLNGPQPMPAHRGHIPAAVEMLERGYGPTAPAAHLLATWAATGAKNIPTVKGLAGVGERASIRDL